MAGGSEASLTTVVTEVGRDALASTGVGACGRSSPLSRESSRLGRRPVEQTSREARAPRAARGREHAYTLARRMLIEARASASATLTRRAAEARAHRAYDRRINRHRLIITRSESRDECQYKTHKRQASEQ